jgi:hypothetical protein
MPLALGAPLGFVATILVLAWFVRLERQGSGHVPAAIALGLLVVESVLLPSHGEVPTGLFRFPALGQDIRLVGAVMILAVIARAWVRGLPHHFSMTGMLWAAYLVWYGTGYLIGTVQGHPSNVVMFEFRSVVFIGASYLLMAGTPLGAFLARRPVGVWTIAVAAGVAVVAFTTLFDLYVDVSFGVQRFPSLGAYGPSGRSVITAIACVLIVTEACRPRPRTWVLVCSGLLLISPVVGMQRASMVNAAVVIVLLGLLVAGSTWRRRASVTPTVSGLVVLGFVGVIVLVIAIPPALSGEPSILVSSLDQAFTGEGQTASADARQRLWSETRSLISEKPVLGWGLGKQSPLTRPFPRETLEVSAHNIGLDIMIRAGAIGMLLFLVALASSLNDAIRTWRRHPDPVIAGFAIACAIGLLGLIGKGMVESIFENFRLALLFGLLIGGIAAARTSRDIEEQRLEIRDQLERSHAPVG